VPPRAARWELRVTIGEWHQSKPVRFVQLGDGDTETPRCFLAREVAQKLRLEHALGALVKAGLTEVHARRDRLHASNAASAEPISENTIGVRPVPEGAVAGPRRFARYVADLGYSQCGYSDYQRKERD